MEAVKGVRMKTYIKKSHPISHAFLYLPPHVSIFVKTYENGTGSRKGCIPPIFA